MSEEYFPLDKFVEISKVCHLCGKRQVTEYMEYCCQLNVYFCREFKPFFNSCHLMYHKK